MSVSANQWTSSLNELSIAFVNEFSNVTAGSLSQRPNDNGWSIVEIITHIIAVNESYYPIFDQVEKGKYVYNWLGNFGFIRRYFGKLILRSVEPSNPKKHKTLPVWQPKEVLQADQCLATLGQHLHRFGERIEQLEPQIRRNVTIASPANEMIVYDIQTALDIILAHAWRHFEQAKRVKKQITG